MRKKDKMLTIADILFTLLCLVTVACWYMQIPYRIQITCVLGVLGLGVLYFMKKGYKSEVEFINSYDKLLENENHFRSAFEYAASGMALLSKNGHYLKVNHSLCQILGFNQEEFLKLSIRKVIQKNDLIKIIKMIRENIQNDDDKPIQEVFHYLNKNGATISMNTNISMIKSKDNQPLYFVGQFQMLNPENLLDKYLNDTAYIDLLTKLPNRSCLNQYISDLLLNAKHIKSGFSLLIVDIDCLRRINNSIGQEEGDNLLITIAQRLKSIVREEDMISRIGGDEFAVVINRVNKSEIIANIAQNIQHQLLKPITLNNHNINITVSIGIGLYPQDGHDIETLLKNADLALYKAKENHGNNYQFCLPDVTKKAHEKTKKKNALANAIAKNEFQLYYQPCLNLEDKSVTSVEALIRWHSDQYGLVMPDTIIPMAEETGLIIPVSEWVIRTACKQVKAWQGKINSDLKLSINISPYQFKSPGFVKSIIRALKESEFPPQNFIIEMTESLITHNYDHTQNLLTELKNEGVMIVVDDFGTGVSSFNYLLNHSVDKIKINKSFIQKIQQDASQETMVGVVISMAKKLGIRTVAEGVETQQQFDYISNEGCDEAQGYYIAKPLPIDLMESFLTSRVATSTENKTQDTL